MELPAIEIVELANLSFATVPEVILRLFTEASPSIPDVIAPLPIEIVVLSAAHTKAPAPFCDKNLPEVQAPAPRAFVPTCPDAILPEVTAPEAIMAFTTPAVAIPIVKAPEG